MHAYNVHVHVHLYVYTYVYVRMRMYAQCVCISICIWGCMPRHAYASLYVCVGGMCACVCSCQLCTRACAYIMSTCVNMCVHLHACSCMYKHMYTSMCMHARMANVVHVDAGCPCACVMHATHHHRANYYVPLSFRFIVFGKMPPRKNGPILVSESHSYSFG